MRNSEVHPFFSVVIPTYNRAFELKKCLNSLVMQTYTNFEVLICDDGSTDNTSEIVQSFDRNLEINHIWNENWGGPARPRNIGIKFSKGKWVCFLDSDDWWYPEKLEELHNYILKNPKTDVICHDIIIDNRNTGKKENFTCGPITPNLYSDLLKQGNRFANSAVSVKKTTLFKHGIFVNESIDAISVEDFDLWLKLASKNVNFGCINLPLGENVLECNNISQESKHFTNLESVLKEHVFNIQSFELNKTALWKEVSASLKIIKAARNFRQKRYFTATKYYFLALVESRSNFQNYIGHLLRYYNKNFNYEASPD